MAKTTGPPPDAEGQVLSGLLVLVIESSGAEIEEPDLPLPVRGATRMSKPKSKVLISELPLVWRFYQGTYLTMKISTLALLFAIGLCPLLADANDPPIPTDLQVPEEILKEIMASNPTDGTDDAVFYIVRMDDDPVVAYEGGNQGLPATKPATGEKINPRDGKVVNYQSYLKDKHDSTLLQVGVESSKKAHDYSVCFDGFSAKLNKKQADELLAISGVISVTKDEKIPMDTITTPDFLGLLGLDGPWTLGHKGEDVIIGILDSGAWPENSSFDDRTGSNKNGVGGKLDYRQIPGWHGKCVPGEGFTAANCNQKLIGAQWFGEGWGGPENIKALFPYEFVSPRAADGHGVHTASTEPYYPIVNV